MTLNLKANTESAGDFLWHPYTRHSALEAGPLPVITRGEGVYLFDAENSRYLDAISSWWACNLGHGHPRIVAAIREQAGKLQHSILGNLSHPRALELAERLAHLFPACPRSVFFGSDGASAVEAALKIAVQYWHNTGRPEKHRFASLKHAYHGDTLGAVSVGYLESFHKQFRSVTFPVHQAGSPCCGTCEFGKTPDTCDLECFASMNAIVRERAAELAAVIVEPLCQGAGGIRIYAPKYLSALRTLCDEENVLLIVDEIAMGFGRTGKMFASEHAGIEGDIICVGKGLSGGALPISATIVSRDLYDTFGDTPEDHTFYHGHSFGGNPIAAAAALGALSIYKEEDIVARAAAAGEVMLREMMPIHEMDAVRDVRCLGMVGAVELADVPGATGAERARQVQAELLERGILLRPLDNVVYLMPPLVIPEEALEEAVAALRTAVGHLA